MIDILTIKYQNQIEVVNTQEVLSYEDGKWPDKNLPFSFPKFNNDNFNFIELPTEKYIVFFALKFSAGFWNDDVKDDILWNR